MCQHLHRVSVPTLRLLLEAIEVGEEVFRHVDDHPQSIPLME
jgi:hypothetical protein